MKIFLILLLTAQASSWVWGSSSAMTKNPESGPVPKQKGTLREIPQSREGLRQRGPLIIAELNGLRRTGRNLELTQRINDYSSEIANRIYGLKSQPRISQDNQMIIQLLEDLYAKVQSFRPKDKDLKSVQEDLNKALENLGMRRKIFSNGSNPLENPDSQAAPLPLRIVESKSEGGIPMRKEVILDIDNIE